MTSTAITLEKAQEMVATYIAAEECVLTGQQYSIGDRSLTRANLAEIVKQREKWEMVCARLEKGTRAPLINRVVPRDC